MTKVPRTVLMQKKRRLAADQDAHLDYKDQEQSTLDYDAAVKIESADMEEFEEAEENIDINVDQGQAVKIEGSSRKRRQVDHKLPCNVCGKRFPNKRRLEVHAGSPCIQDQTQAAAGLAGKKKTPTSSRGCSVALSNPREFKSRKQEW